MFDNIPAKNDTLFSGIVHFSPRFPRIGLSSARKRQHLATIQRPIQGPNGQGHKRNPGSSQTRIRASFCWVIFAGFGHNGIVWIRRGSALQTLLNSAIILRRKIAKLYRIMVVILRKSVTGPEKQGDPGLIRARMGDGRFGRGVLCRPATSRGRHRPRIRTH